MTQQTTITRDDVREALQVWVGGEETEEVIDWVRTLRGSDDYSWAQDLGDLEEWVGRYLAYQSKVRTGSGQANAKYLASLPGQKKEEILRHIAKHYGVSTREIEDELGNSDAEDLFEYAATNRSLAMEIMKGMKSQGLIG